MDWNDEAIARLRALWAEGHSTAEIGRRLGVSKNAVVGKAHRLLLEPRPSPIRRAPVAEAAKRPPVRRPADAAPPEPVVARLPPPVASSRVALAPVPALRTVTRGSAGRSMSCCWPIGEPGTRSFRFCDAGSLPNKPYCGEHAALAYVKIRDRREDAA